MTPQQRAQTLIDFLGPAKAWNEATVAVFSAHLSGDVKQRVYWQNVQAVMQRIAPLPNADDTEIADLAARMIADSDAHAATTIAWELAIEADDLATQILWQRVSDAVTRLSKIAPK